jgi:hypothetical protein
VDLGSFSVGDLLVGIHAMVAEATGTPQLALTKSEGEKLGGAIQDVAKQYNHVINPKTAAWIQLCIVCGAVYGTRIASIRMDAKTARRRKLEVVPKTNGFPQPDFTPPVPDTRPGDM